MTEQRVVGERAVRTAVLLVVVLTAGAYLPSPLSPDYQHLFGFEDLVMTLLFATFALVSGPALGWAGVALTGLALTATRRFASPARQRTEARPPVASGVDHQVLQRR